MDNSPQNLLLGRLGALCREYNSSKISGSDLVQNVHAVVRKDGKQTAPGLQMLLKRVERSCGRHFCKLWDSCSKSCEYGYEGGPLEFQNQLAHLIPFPASQVTLDARSPKGKVEVEQENSDVIEDSEGFIMCQKDDAVQSAAAQDLRKEALARALAHMQQYSIRRGEKRRGDHTASNSLKVLVDSDQHPHAAPEEFDVEMKESSPLPSPTVEARVIPFRSVPVVDLSKPISVVASKIGEACRNVGFFYIVNHGVEQAVIDRQLEYSKKFFRLDANAKRALDNRKSAGGIRGYFAIGQENLNTAQGEQLARYHGDLKEGFDIGFESADGSNPNSSFRLAGSNLWPDESGLERVKGFRQQSLLYYSEMLKLGRKLMGSFALALGLPSDHFQGCLQDPVATLRMLHYPPQHPSDTNNKIGCGAHTDYGCCTILLQDATGGLQVRNSKMQWIHAPPVPGSYIINIGDMLSRWTNNVFASTVHRVVNTGPGNKDRYSIPFFLNPSFDTSIECLPTCVNEGHNPSYKSATCEEILMERYSETFEHLKK